MHPPESAFPCATSDRTAAVQSGRPGAARRGEAASCRSRTPASPGSGSLRGTCSGGSTRFRREPSCGTAPTCPVRRGRTTCPSPFRRWSMPDNGG